MARNLINASQHGFLNKRSCATCMTSFLDRATHELDKGNSMLLLYLDFHKAFDRVPHHRLLLKLKSFGIVNPLYSWLTSFLQGRQQSVDILGNISSTLPISSGVIQGSVLGPLLFLIYVNDFSSVLQHGKMLVFGLYYSESLSFTQYSQIQYIRAKQKYATRGC